MKFDLWRILGNDLPPRHPNGQTLQNLKYILENEKQFGMTRKMWLLNRIVDNRKCISITNLLYDHGVPKEHIYHIPFFPSEFHSLPSASEKLKYITNVNPARNHCLDISFDQGADVCCPEDGGMFFREDGWMQFRMLAEDNPEDGYFGFPTWRVDNLDTFLTAPPILKSEYDFGTHRSIGMTELQLAFTKHHDKEFNEDCMYGNADKVELLYRLGLLGLWDHWAPELRKKAVQDPSKFYGEVKLIGYICILPSGNPEGDRHNLLRGSQRSQGLQDLLTHLETVST